MKKILFISLFVSFRIFGQSVLINPSDEGILSKNATLCTTCATFGNFVPLSGGGTKFMWLPELSAFRAGTVDDNTNYWDTGLVGNWSFATGYNTVARGNYSTAYGLRSKAMGNLTTAFGWSVEANDYATFACGSYNVIATGSREIFYQNEQLFVIGNGISDNARKNAVTVLKNGNVGIGVLNPNEILDVNGRMRVRHTIISNVPFSSGVWFNNSANSLSIADGAFYGMKTDTETGFYIGNAWRFWVNSAGNGYLNGNLIQTSDRRLKKEFYLLNNSLSSIYKLNGYHFKWIEEARSKDLQTGLIAQEVQNIFPELVQTDEKGFLSVNYIGLVPHLIEAIKELRDENNALKTSNKIIKKNNQILTSRLDKIEAMLSNFQPNMENPNTKK